MYSSQHDLSLIVADDQDYSDSEYFDNKDDSSSSSSSSNSSKKRGRNTIQNGIRRSPNKWSKEENKRLFELVNQYGEKKWKKISAEMGSHKTGAQCAQHWKRVLSPDIRKGPWDEDEEELLFRLVNQHGSSWKKIAKRISKRTDIQCRYQYLKALQSREVQWVPKEDESLIRRVQDMESNISWLEVSEHLAKLKHTNTLRTALECKARYLLITNSSSDQIDYHQQQTQQQPQQNNHSLPSSPLSDIQYLCDQQPVQINNNSNNTNNSNSNNNGSTQMNSLVPSLSSTRITISNLTSPVSSPLPSPPSSPQFHSLKNINNQNNQNNNDIYIFKSNTNRLNQQQPLLPSINQLNSNNNNKYCLKKSGSYGDNMLIDSKLLMDQQQSMVKKQKTNNHYNDSDQSSSDDDAFNNYSNHQQPILSKSLSFNNIKLSSSSSIMNNNNGSNFTSPFGGSPITYSPSSSFSMIKPRGNSLSNSSSSLSNYFNSSSSSLSSSSSNSARSTPISYSGNNSPTSSPLSSFLIPSSSTTSSQQQQNNSLSLSIDKLRNTSFDFFNLESLAALASSQPKQARNHPHYQDLQVN